MKNPTALALAMAAMAAMTGSPLTAQPVGQQSENAGLEPKNDQAADLIIAGEKRAALNKLQKQLSASPDDPLVLINIGITYAQLGLDEKARTAFTDALTSSNRQELDTADGRTMDSRRLARIALGMLERGEFQAGQDQLSRRE